MFKTIKNRSSRAALAGAICLLALPFMVSCRKESPTVSAADLVAAATDALPGYFYPSVMATYPINGAIGVPSDTSYVIVFSIPVDAGQFDFTVGAYSLTDNIRITTTSFPGGLTDGTHYTVTPNAGDTTVAVIDFIGPLSTLPANEVVNIYIGTSTTQVLQDIDHTATLNNPGLWTFTAAAAPDTTAPTPNLGSRNPAPGATGVSRTTPNIRITINEANGINPTTVNSATFWLEEFGSGIDIPCSISAPAGANPIITLTPRSSLTTNMQYRVTLTTGVEDLSGNPLSAGTNWSFTTEFTDPIPGEPLVIDGPNCTGFDAAGTTAYLNWTTNESTNCTLHYGRGNDVSLATPLSGPLCFHGLSLGGLGAGDRYWMQLTGSPPAATGDVVDMTGEDNSVTYGPFEFNTPTNEAPVDVHSLGTNSQILPYAIPNRFMVASPGIFLFYTDLDGGFRKLYNQRYSSALVAQWGAPHGLYTANQQFYFQSAIEDELGGVITIASINSATSGIYVKRINADGSFFNWGTDADAAGDIGLGIDNNGANDGVSASAVPVYTGQVSVITDGVIEREATPANTLFEDDELPWGGLADFSGLVAGDHVLDTTAPTPHVHRTVTTAPTIFRRILVTSANIPAGNTYQIARSATNDIIYDGATPVNNHHIRTTPDGAFVADYDSGGTLLYTQHAYTPPGWMGDGDFIDANGTWGIVAAALAQPWAAPGTRLPAADEAIDSEGDQGGYWRIWDNDQDFGGLFVIDGDIVYNVTDGLSEFVYQTPGAGDNFLDINTQAGFTAGDFYRIYQGQYCETHLADGLDNDFYRITADWAMGFTEPVTVYDSYNTDHTADMTADELPGPNPLFDNDSNFIASGVAGGDVVLDFIDDDVATVDGGYAIHRHALRLNNDIGQNGQSYAIIRFNDGVTTQGDIATVGRTTGVGTGVLYDATNSFPGVVAGSVVFSLESQEYAMVTAVYPNDRLELSRGISFAVNDRYMVFRQRGVLYVWEEAGNIYCRTMSMANGTTQLRATALLFAGTQPHAIPDGAGNALLIYRDGANVIQARLLDSRGATVFGPIPIDTDHANMDILRVEQDRNTVNPDRGGAMVLYTYGGGASLATQWVRNTGGALARGNGGTWPDGGRLVVAGAVTTSDMSFNYNGGNPYAVVTYQQANKIHAGCVGQFTWSNPISTPATGIQQKPRIFLNGANTIILWEDNRFLSNVGYGVFGMKIAATTGAKDAGWRANTSGADDYNGVAVILNGYNQAWPSQSGTAFSMCLMPYNGTEAALFWEDYRTPLVNANIDMLRIDNFTP